MKHFFSNRCAKLFAVAMTLTMSVTSYATTADSRQQEDSDMRAPRIEADANGIITLDQCPTFYDGLMVALSDDLTKASIYNGNQLIQTITASEDDPFATDGDKSVHFLDANFDGYVDIFIGAGVSRTYSSLLLWNPSTKQFVMVGASGGAGSLTFQNFMLHPESKSVFMGGSSSYCSSFFERYIWNGNDLKVVEELTIVNVPKEYKNYNVNSRFTLKDDKGNVIVSAKKEDKLPGLWKKIVIF